MLGEIGILFVCSAGTYMGLKRMSSKEYKIEKLWNKALISYPHQNGIRNIKGHTFGLRDIRIEGDNITARVFIPLGLSVDDFNKIIPVLERAFYGSISLTSDYHLEIVTGRKELC